MFGKSASPSTSGSEANILRPTLNDLLHDNFERFIHRHEERGYRLGFLRLVPPPEFWKEVQLPDNIINRKIESTNSQQLTPLSKKIKLKDKGRPTNFPYYLQNRIPSHHSSVTEYKAMAQNEPSTTSISSRHSKKRRKGHSRDPLHGSGRGPSFWSEAPKSQPVDADEVEGSRCSLDTIYWSLPILKTLLQRVCTYLGIILIGVTTPFLYYGQWLTKSCWHVEDLMLFNITFLHEGADKTWYIIPPGYRNEFAEFAEMICGKEFGMNSKKRRCDNFLQHKTFFMNPTELKKVGIPFTEVVQKEKEIIITFPGAYHCGYNHGYNCAESLNFAMPSWLPYGTEAKICKHDRRAVQFTSEMKIVADFMKDLIRKRMARARARHPYPADESCFEQESSDQTAPPQRRHPPPPTPPPLPPRPPQRSILEPPLSLQPPSSMWTSFRRGSCSEQETSLSTPPWFPQSPSGQSPQFASSPPRFQTSSSQFGTTTPKFDTLPSQFASSPSPQFALRPPKFTMTTPPPPNFAAPAPRYPTPPPTSFGSQTSSATSLAAPLSRYSTDSDNTEGSDYSDDVESTIDLSSDDESEAESVPRGAGGGGPHGCSGFMTKPPHQNIQLQDLRVRVKRIKLLRKDDSHYVIDDDSDADLSPSRTFGLGEKGFASQIPISEEEEQFFGSLPSAAATPASNYGTESEGLVSTDTLNWDQLILNMHVQSTLSASGAEMDASKRGRFQCLRCLRVYSWKKNCMEHIRRVHHNKRTKAAKTVKLTVACSQCRKKFATRASLNRHIGQAHKSQETATSADDSGWS